MKTEGELLNKKKFTVKTIIITVAVILAVVGLFMLLPWILNALGQIIWLMAPFIAAYLISLLANPMADGLQKRFRLPRGISAILVIVLIVGVIGGIVTGIIWKIIDEIRNVYEDFPIIYENIRATWYRISENLSDIVVMLPENIQNAVNDMSEQVLDWISGLATNMSFFRTAGNAAKKLPNVFVSVIVFLLSLYFMVSDSKTVAIAVRKPFSEEVLMRMSDFRKEIKRYVGGYVKAQLIIMCISFTILFIGLSILHVDYAFVIALATGIFDALPLFGSGAILIPWAIISFITGEIAKGIGLLIIYLSVIFMRQLVEPKIVSQNIGMHPIMTLMAMYVGYRTLSIGGMILGPLILMLVFSLHRVGVFDGLIKIVKNISAKVISEIKKIKISFDNEGE